MAGKIEISCKLHDCIKYQSVCPSVSPWQFSHPSIHPSVNPFFRHWGDQIWSPCIIWSVFQSVSLVVIFMFYVLYTEYYIINVCCLQAQIEDGPDDDGNMFTRPGKVGLQAKYDFIWHLSFYEYMSILFFSGTVVKRGYSWYMYFFFPGRSF